MENFHFIVSAELIHKMRKSVSVYHSNVIISCKEIYLTPKQFLFQYNNVERINVLLLAREIGGSYLNGWWIIHTGLSGANNQKSCSDCGLRAHKVADFRLSPNFVLSTSMFREEFKFPCKMMSELDQFRWISKTPATAICEALPYG